MKCALLLSFKIILCIVQQVYLHLFQARINHSDIIGHHQLLLTMGVSTASHFWDNSQQTSLVAVLTLFTRFVLLAYCWYFKKKITLSRLYSVLGFFLKPLGLLANIPLWPWFWQLWFLYTRQQNMITYISPVGKWIPERTCWVHPCVQVNCRYPCLGASQAENAFCYYIQRHAWLQTLCHWRLWATSLPGVFSFI